ncbi:MAG TPA: DUF1802 family protein [Planctomycetaceae bacterium]|jgi:hypothetical protein|nr:DUF1802 family protein [Planctomycetaceae bacterium]
MQSTNRHAFKEWAATCRALADGSQSLLLRKGGIHERSGRFTVEHREFWLFPTQFHQTADDFRPEAASVTARAAAAIPPKGIVRIELYAVVSEVIELSDEARLARLSALQILNEATLVRRFHYRTPGLFVLPVRILRLSRPIELEESSHFAGCRTWVDLERDLPTGDLSPALPDAVHEERFARIREALTP